jgi:hypothetical protein
MPQPHRRKVEAGTGYDGDRSDAAAVQKGMRGKEAARKAELEDQRLTVLALSEVIISATFSDSGLPVRLLCPARSADAGLFDCLASQAAADALRVHLPGACGMQSKHRTLMHW